MGEDGPSATEIGILPDEYKTEVGSMETELSTILDQLGEPLQEGKYDLLIGDDTSGRLPTLVMREVINHIYQKNGLPKIPTNFIQAG